jgi:hypothetical protein
VEVGGDWDWIKYYLKINIAFGASLTRTTMTGSLAVLNYISFMLEVQNKTDFDFIYSAKKRS